MTLLAICPKCGLKVATLPKGGMSYHMVPDAARPGFWKKCDEVSPRGVENDLP